MFWAMHPISHYASPKLTDVWLTLDAEPILAKDSDPQLNPGRHLGEAAP
jgi:hypothetical protein